MYLQLMVDSSTDSSKWSQGKWQTYIPLNFNYQYQISQEYIQ